MPSPVGHALAGIAIARLDPTRRSVLVCGTLAAAADLDLLVPSLHRTATHSVTAVALTFILAAAMTGQVTRWKAATVCALAYASHLLLDWLGADTHPPLGIQMLWPFSDRWFISGANLFSETARRHLFALPTLAQNARAIGQEVAILLPVVALVWLIRIKPAARLAPEIAGRDHPAQ